MERRGKKTVRIGRMAKDYRRTEGNMDAKGLKVRKNVDAR
jgi:hypothetical protein